MTLYSAIFPLSFPKGPRMAGPSSESPAPAAVFSQNLRALVAGAASISAVCRALDINRTQFNRYLSGEAHPRPEVLARICAYFDQDARILLEPLSVIRAKEPPFSGTDVDLRPFRSIMSNFDHARMPDGLYRLVLPGLLDPEKLHIDLIRLYTMNDGLKGVNWSVPRYFAENTGRKTDWHARKASGLVFQHPDGVSLLLASSYAPLVQMIFVSPGYRGLPSVHTGFSTLTAASSADAIPFKPVMLEKLPDGIGPALATRRQRTDFGQSELSPIQRSFFETWKIP